MSSFTLNNTAADIDSAITRVVSADNTPTANSDNMVTSAGVKGAIDQLAASSTLTVNSFTPTALETSTDGLTATDTAVPTSKAVKDEIVSSQRSLGSYTTIGASGTATTDGFIVATGTPDEYDSFVVRVAGIDFISRMSNNDSKTYTVTVPIAAGMSWAISGGGGVKKFIPLS